jgi:hypothetical protein
MNPKKNISQLLILMVTNLTADSSFDYKIRKNDAAVLKCKTRCQPILAKKRQIDMPTVDREQCFAECLEKIPMTDQERVHRINRTDFY